MQPWLTIGNKEAQNFCRKYLSFKSNRILNKLDYESTEALDDIVCFIIEVQIPKSEYSNLNGNAILNLRLKANIDSDESDIENAYQDSVSKLRKVFGPNEGAFFITHITFFDNSKDAEIERFDVIEHEDGVVDIVSEEDDERDV